MHIILLPDMSVKALTWSEVVLTLLVVCLALSREAVGLVVVTWRAILLVHICWALGWFTSTVLRYVTLSTGASACGSIGLEPTCTCAAFSLSALCTSCHSACSGIATWIITFLCIADRQFNADVLSTSCAPTYLRTSTVTDLISLSDSITTHRLPYSCGGLIS